MGYALISLVNNNDLDRGPTLVTRTINKRDIDEAFINDFKLRVSRQGLHNRLVDSAIVVGIRPHWVNVDSLLQMKGTTYTNHVVWMSEDPKEGPREMILLNGNHRRHYMQTVHPVMDIYHKHRNAQQELATTKDTDINLKATLEHAIEQTRKIIDQEGVWLAQFMNMGKSAQHVAVLCKS